MRKETFSVFLAELYGLCLSIAHIVCSHHPYIESVPTLSVCLRHPYIESVMTLSDVTHILTDIHPKVLFVK